MGDDMTPAELDGHMFDLHREGWLEPARDEHGEIKRDASGAARYTLTPQARKLVEAFEELGTALEEAQAKADPEHKAAWGEILALVREVQMEVIR